MEIHNLQRSYKEMYERENRMLCEARDHTVLEKDSREIFSPDTINAWSSFASSTWVLTAEW